MLKELGLQYSEILDREIYSVLHMVFCALKAVAWGFDAIMPVKSADALSQMGVARLNLNFYDKRWADQWKKWIYEEKMSDITAGIPLPPGFQLPF